MKIEELREREKKLTDAIKRWKNEQYSFEVWRDKYEKDRLKAAANEETCAKDLTAIRAEIAAAEKAAELAAPLEKFPKGTRVRVTGDMRKTEHGFTAGTVGVISPGGEKNMYGNPLVVSSCGNAYVHPDDLEVIPEPFCPPNRITHSDQLRAGDKVVLVHGGKRTGKIKIVEMRSISFAYGNEATEHEFFADHNIAAPGEPTIPIKGGDNWVERVEDAPKEIPCLWAVCKLCGMIHIGMDSGDPEKCKPKYVCGVPGCPFCEPKPDKHLDCPCARCPHA